MDTFAERTKKAAALAYEIGPEYGGPLRMLTGMEDEIGPLDDATDLQLEVIALAMGLEPTIWRNVAATVPLAAAHAHRIIDCLEESARLWEELTSFV